jgi:hypothetical protein
LQLLGGKKTKEIAVKITKKIFVLIFFKPYGKAINDTSEKNDFYDISPKKREWHHGRVTPSTF